ncbi:MAG: Ig-like domain-containing protein, partial [Candidatus Marinimicrobia bacterium]|nr:Ig-like domain-containing protein [Candidatus Neomarinimicrobiota bacterium]
TTVTDTLGNPLAGTTVSFSAGAGSVSSNSVISDANGLATITLISSARLTDTTVTVSAAVTGHPAVTANIDIDFRGLTLIVSANPIVLPADGSATSTISIGLVETTNGNPITSKLVALATNLGSIPSSIVTDVVGNASVNLTSNTTTGTATVTVDAGVTATTNVEFISTAPKYLDISADQTSIIADNSASTTISTTVTDTLGNPLAGTTVNFSAGAGTVSSNSIVSDASGLATITLISSARTTDTTVTVTATVTGYPAVTDDIDIDFRGITVTIAAAPDRIPADGVSTAEITVELQETTNGNPLVDKPISLTTTLGTITASDITNANGTTTTNLIAGTTAGSATITVDAGVTASTTVDFSSISLTLTADGTDLLANSVSSLQITALLQDQVTGNPLADRTIYWTTTLGSIPASATTGANGSATNTLTAGTNAGTAKVKGFYGTSLVDSVSITINAASDSTIILSWYNPNGNPSDGTEILNITAILNDANGNPVSGNTIAFSVTPTAFGSIYPGIATGTDGTATVEYTYSSQYAGQTVRITATSQSGGSSSDIDVTLPEAN